MPLINFEMASRFRSILNFIGTIGITIPIGVTFVDCVGYVARVDG